MYPRSRSPWRKPSALVVGPVAGESQPMRYTFPVCRASPASCAARRPKDSARKARRPSLDDLIRPRQHRLRDCQTEGLRRLEIDDQLELGRLLDGQVRRLGASEDLVHVDGAAPVEIDVIRAVAHPPKSGPP